MNCSLIISILLVNIFLVNLDANAQSKEINNLIRDTVALHQAKDLLYSDVEQNILIDDSRVLFILKSSLNLRDTLSFYSICNSLSYRFYYKKQLYQEGIVFLKESIKLLGLEEHRFGDFNNSLGKLYLELNYNIEAINYFYKSIEWHQKYDKPNTTIPLGNLAEIYFNNKEFEKSLEYNEKALAYSLKLTNKRDKLYNVTYDYFRIGGIYQELNNRKKANLYFEKSLEAARELNEDNTMLLALAKALQFYSQIGDTEKCENLIIEGNEICNEIESCKFSSGEYFIIQKNWYYLRSGQLDLAATPEELKFKSPSQQNEINLYSANYYSGKKDIEKTIYYYEKLFEENQKAERANRANVYSNIEEGYLNKKLRIENEELLDDIENRKRLTLITIFALISILSLLILQSINNRRYQKVNNLLKIKGQDLESTNKELANSNQELERFMFIASHDLKTPLRNMISFTSLLEKKLKLHEDESVKEYLSFIKEGGHRLNNLITDTLEFSTLSKKEMKIEKVDLRKLLDELERTISIFIDKRNAKILKLNRLPSIQASHSLLFLLFKNLIENGIKYNISETPTIKISFERKDDFSSIFIEDNGIGIDDRYQDKIFIMFSKLHTHNDYKGSGLGLSTCKKIVKNLNGEIHLNSVKNEGSKFEIKFPNSIVIV